MNTGKNTVPNSKLSINKKILDKCYNLYKVQTF